MRSIAWALTTSSFLAHHLSFIFRSSTPTGVVVPAASAAASVTTRAIAIGSNYHRNFQQPKQRLLSSRKRNSNKQEMSNDPSNLYTTNEEDQRKAAALQARLKNRTSAKQRDSSSPPKDELRLPSVEIAEGAHKYVLIKAVDPYNGDEQYFVTSRKGAHYHRNAAEPMIAKLEEAGYEDMEVTGGGRIDLNVAAKTCRIFGFSYSFGLANHAISQRLIRADPRYRDFEITISDDGY
jgi:phosphohistidine phosphatase